MTLPRGVSWVAVGWLEDGELVTADHGRASKAERDLHPGGLVYVVGRPRPSELERLVRPGDTATRTGRRLVGLTLRGLRRRGVRARTTRVMLGSSWGLEADTPEGGALELEELRGAVAEEGWTWAPTAGSLGARLAPRAYQDPPAIRALAHHAIHPGPMRVYRASSPDALAVDLSSAYLRAMLEPVPRGPWTVARWSPRWSRIRELDGLVYACVNVPEGGYAPLPELRTDRRSRSPVGTFWGVWTIPTLRLAEELFWVSVRKVEQAALCTAVPLYASLVKRLELVQSKRLRKTIYTRLWSRWAMTGAWVGHHLNAAPEDAGPMLGSRLRWTWDGLEHPWARYRPAYRPSHSAYIASRTHQAMMRAARGMKPGSIVAEHVDCIWTEDRYAAARLVESGAWKVKTSGPLRFYAPGCYEHGGKLGSQGYDRRKRGPLTLASLEAHVQSGARRWSGSWGREWTGGHPAFDPGACSTAPDLGDPWLVADDDGGSLEGQEEPRAFPAFDSRDPRLCPRRHWPLEGEEAPGDIVSPWCG